MADFEARREEGGFTLVELMMALVIFSVAVAGILSVAVSLTNGFREQRQAISAQDAVRSPIDLIADALRQASPGVADPTLVYDTTTCTQGAISVVNSTADADVLDIIYASGGVVTTTHSGAASSGSTAISVINSTNFAIGDYVMFTDFATGHVVQLTNVTPTAIEWAPLACSTTNTAITTWSYAAGAAVVRVQHARFSVSNDASNNNMPTLWMDADSIGTALSPEPLAEGIEDMQIVIGVDGDNANGIVEGSPASSTDEWFGNHPSDVVFNPTTQRARAVRVTMIARTTAIQMGDRFTYTKPPAEDRTAASANDQYRRRVLRTVVDVRNVSGSP